MNYFVEGLQGSGKSTLVQKLSELHPECTAIREGDYSPVELAWCAYVDEKKYREILDKYADIREQIEAKTFSDADDSGRKIICYTQIITDIPGFHKDLEQYEIYNNRVSFEGFKSIILKRYNNWSKGKIIKKVHNNQKLQNDQDAQDTNNMDQTSTQESMIFECSLFQNIVEDMILFKCATDEEILEFYKSVREALEGKDYHIIYLKAEDVRGNLDVIRKERSDDKGNELWFPLMMRYFEECPYSKEKGLSGEEDLVKHFIHRQELELRIIEKVFSDRCTVIASKNYTDEDILK